MQAEFLFRKHKCRVHSQPSFFGSFFFFPCDKSKSILGERTAERPSAEEDGQLWKEVENRIGKKARQSQGSAEGQRPWVGGGPTHPTRKLLSLRQRGAISLKSTYHKEVLTLPVPYRHDWNRDTQSQTKSRQSEVTDVAGTWQWGLMSWRVLVFPMSDRCTIGFPKLHMQSPQTVPLCDYDQRNWLLKFC